MIGCIYIFISPHITFTHSIFDIYFAAAGCLIPLRPAGTGGDAPRSMRRCNWDSLDSVLLASSHAFWELGTSALMTFVSDHFFFFFCFTKVNMDHIYHMDGKLTHTSTPLRFFQPSLTCATAAGSRRCCSHCALDSLQLPWSSSRTALMFPHRTLPGKERCTLQRPTRVRACSSWSK
jgi:hypothetical protein